MDGAQKKKGTWEETYGLGDFFPDIEDGKRAKLVEEDSNDLMIIFIGKSSLEQDFASLYQGLMAAKR